MGSQHMTSTSKRPFGWRELATLLLDENGMIRDCSNTGEELFGYTFRDIVSQHVSKLLPQLSGVELVKDGQLNPKLDYLCHCGHLFEVQTEFGGILPSELSLVSLEHAGKRILKLFILPDGNLDGEARFG